MPSPVLVTGGTGRLGGHVVPLLRRADHDLRILTRHPRDPAPGIQYVAGDLRRDTGIEPAVSGVDTIVHLAGGPKGDDDATRNLVRAAKAAGVQHVVYISVIGADRLPLGYFRAKLGAEDAIAESGIPFSMLRAAQFHDLVLGLVTTMGTLPVVPVPGGLRFQPVDARDVAERLAELVDEGPAGRVADLAGPTLYDLGALADTYLETRGKRRAKLPVRIPGKAGRAYRAGANVNLTTGDHGERTWEAFLAERSAPSGRPALAGHDLDQR